MSNVLQKGQCCAGNLCTNTNLTLNPTHKCFKCNRIVHICCAELTIRTDAGPNERDDVPVCFSCVEKSKTGNSPPAPQISLPIIHNPPTGTQFCMPVGVNSSKKAASSSSTSSKKTEKATKCRSCGKEGHSRKSSSLCPFYVPRNTKAQKKGDTTSTPQSTIPTSHHPAPLPSVPPLPSIPPVPPLPTSATSTSSTTTTTTTTTNTDDSKMNRPTFIKVGSKNNKFTPVVDVASKDFNPIDTKFKLMGVDENGRELELEPTTKNLTNKYWNLNIIDKMVESSNCYIKLHRKKEPNLKCWKNEKVSAPFTRATMYHFLALVSYFGMVKMPSRRDYWSTHYLLPRHRIATELGMTRNRFDFLWRHFHCNTPQQQDSDDDDYDSEDDDDDHNEDGEDFLVVDRLRNRGREEVENEKEDGEEDEEEKKVWFDKIKPLLDHFRDTSEELVHTLGTILSFDEMMIRAMGKSIETHRMKNKPIGEGYKYFVLATTRGFTVNFTPDGRSAEKNGKQEYEMDKTKGKIECMVNHVTKVIDKFRARQKERIQNLRTSTRNSNSKLFDEKMMDKFIVAMDNYFTRPKVIKSLRDNNIGVVGTSRLSRGWPSKELKAVSDDADFNDFFYEVDDDGTVCARWMDNGLVFIVSTCHKVGKTVERLRRRPRLTKKTKIMFVVFGATMGKYV